MTFPNEPSWFNGSTLILGDQGHGVEVVRRKLGMPPAGGYDVSLAARVRGFQQARGLEPTGEVDSDTAVELGDEASYGLVPEWFVDDLALGDDGPDVRVVRERMGLPGGDLFDSVLEDRLKQWQSAHGFYPDGVVTQATAVLIGD